MLKKIILASAILTTTTGAAIANPAPYVGASVGITTNTSTVKVAGTSFSGGSFRGVPVNLFAGYGGVINQSFYLAGELFGTLATANISDSRNMKTSYGFGAAVLPGVMLSDHTLAYVRGGILRARFPQGKGNTRTGGQFGAGMQTSLTQNIDLRGEYDFVSYRSYNQIVSGTTRKVSPRADQFSLGLIYKFD